MPGESISPKMHILEDHMVPFLKKWKLGCGFYGEQGMLSFFCVIAPFYFKYFPMFRNS